MMMVAKTIPWHSRILFILINKKKGARLKSAESFRKELIVPVENPVYKKS